MEVSQGNKFHIFRSLFHIYRQTEHYFVLRASYNHPSHVVKTWQSPVESRLVNGSSTLVPLGVHEDLATLGESSTTLLETGLGEGVGRLPLGRGPGGGLGHHLIDLLQGQTLGLGNEEVGVDESDCAETSPDEEHRGAKVTLIDTDHVGGNDGDDGVPEPVGGGGERNTTGADGERENLTNQNPGTRTPGGGEEKDEDGDERDLSVDSRKVVGAGGAISKGSGLVEAHSDTDDSNEELADQHAESAVEQECATTELLHSVERERSGAYVDECKDQGDQESVADSASRLEERCRVVEDEVDTGPLLHHLKGGTEDGLAEVGVGLEERTLEAVGPAGQPATSGGQLALVLLVGNDLSKLEVNHGTEVLSIRAGRVNTANLHQRLPGLVGLSTLDEVTGRVRQGGNTSGKDDTPGELDTNRNAVFTSVTTVLDCVVDAGGKQKTDGDAELVTRNERTTDLLGADLGHVKNDNSRLETDTDTSNGTTSNKEVTARGGNLEYHTYDYVSKQALHTLHRILSVLTDDVDETSDNNGPLAADDVGEVTSNEGTKESTSRQNRDNKRGVATADGAFGTRGAGCTALDLLDEEFGGENTVDVTGIVTIRHTISVTPTQRVWLQTYPKKIPPKEAKAQSRYAFQVTGASVMLTSVVALMEVRRAASSFSL